MSSQPPPFLKGMRHSNRMPPIRGVDPMRSREEREPTPEEDQYTLGINFFFKLQKEKLIFDFYRRCQTKTITSMDKRGFRKNGERKTKGS